MFNYIKYRKLRLLLEDGKIVRGKERIDQKEVYKYLNSIFDLHCEDGRSNAHRFIDILQSKQEGCIRIKMLIVLHTLCVDYPGWSDFIAELPRLEFQGVNITRKDSSSNNPNLMGFFGHQMTHYSVNNITEPKNSSYEINSSISSNHNKSVVNTRTVIDESFNYNDVNVYLHLYLVVPYFAYIVKLAVNHDLVQQAKGFMNCKVSTPDFPLIWKLINTLKSVLQIRCALTNIGRYYLHEHSYIIDLIEALTRDFYNFYGLFEKHLNRALTCFRDLTKTDLQQLINVLEELSDLNEALYEVYFNRYYYKLLKHILPPKWVTVENNEYEAIFKHFRQQFGLLQLNSKKKQDERVLKDNLLKTNFKKTSTIELPEKTNLKTPLSSKLTTHDNSSSLSSQSPNVPFRLQLTRK